MLLCLYVTNRRLCIICFNVFYKNQDKMHQAINSLKNEESFESRTKSSKTGAVNGI